MASARKTGKYGSLYLHVNTSPALASVTKFADTFNWRFESDQAMHECTRKGEGFARFMPGTGTARFTCQAHIQALAVLLPLADDDLVTLTSVPTSLPSLVRVAFKLVTLSEAAPGSALAAADTPTSGQQIIQGFGWVTRGNIEVPFDQRIVEEFEIQVDGEWEFVTTT